MSPLQNVLVTGATGQIGYMVYKQLAEQTELFNVYALDNKRAPSVRVPKSWQLEIPDEKFILADLADDAAVAQAVQNMDIVVHLGADSNGDSWDSLLNNNIIGTYNIFETSKQAGVRRIVAASSIMVSQGHRCG